MEALKPPTVVLFKDRAETLPASAARHATRGNRAAELAGLGAIFVQAALIALIMRDVGLETLALRRAVYIAVGGFVVHHLLPFRLRLPFFVFLSLVSMALILGGTVDSRIPDLMRGLLRAGTILTVGVVLIALCHLSIGFWQRAGLLLASGLALAGLRVGLWDTGVLAVVWPILAAIFMFRVMVYLYDRATSPKPPSPSQSLAYFFLFPNVCTLLFPVVDFRTFCQKYYDEDALLIYQRGIKWMARGVMHLLLYRVIDRLVAIDAASVADGTDLIQFLVSNLFLYLKVSGSFHLVVGMLLLFGFNLPETNHRYFLAASFTDYWRRVNIYWRNFIMKVFYYPAFFRFKKLGQVKALIIATLWSFFVTWAFHLYQTWWIKGGVAWTWPDTLFWTALAVLVLANSLWELKRNRQRKLATGSYSKRETLGVALRTAATFTVIGVLWSLWSTPTLTQWLHLWELADLHTLAWGGAVLMAVMIATVLFEVLPARWQWGAVPSAENYARTRHFRREILQCGVPLVALFGVTHPLLQARLDASNSPRLADASAFVRLVSERDGEAHGQGRGYYENLTAAATDQGSGQFFETMNPGQGLRYAQPTRAVEGVHFHELIPNTHFEHHGWRFATNRWGMRDRDYEQTRSPAAVRIALLGSSHVMGYGLTDKDMFEPAIEDRLNAEHGGHGRFEILNFGLGGMSPFGQSWLLQNRAAKFKPDIVLFVGHLNDSEWSNRDVVRTLRKRVALSTSFPQEVFTQAGVDRGTPEAFAVARLRAFEPALLAFCYQQIVRESRAIEATPIYVFLPLPSDLPLDQAKTAPLLRFAEEAGFVVLDLSDVYGERDSEELLLKDQGHHLNALGNAVVAAALYERLTADPRIDLLNRARRRQEGVSAYSQPTRQ